MKAYEINQFGIENLSFIERDEPKPNAGEVVVKFRAASLNYRDLMMVKGFYNPKLKMPLIPFSDGAGEVVALGENVTKWKMGDRVCPIFMQGWTDGAIDFQKARTALGGDLDGVLREFGAFSENGLVVSGNIKPDQTILLQGTGGVSIFALQFANVFGCRTIITSSSDEKLKRAKDLGAEDIINYAEREDWDKAVLDLTEKRGVDTVVEVGGAGTMQKSLNAVAVGGHIAVIGVLAGKGEFDVRSALMKSVKMQGIYVGSRQMFEDMNRLICQHNLKPVVDKVFEFGEVREALKCMESASHFGKIVVKIN